MYVYIIYIYMQMYHDSVVVSLNRKEHRLASRGAGGASMLMPLQFQWSMPGGEALKRRRVLENLPCGKLT